MSDVGNGFGAWRPMNGEQDWSGLGAGGWVPSTQRHSSVMQFVVLGRCIRYWRVQFVNLTGQVSSSEQLEVASRGPHVNVVL